MHTPRTLLLAVAAVGLAGSASAAHAQFANVFVPELAMVDAMRRAPGAAGFSLLGIAQDVRDKGQKKSDITAAPAAAKSGVENRAVQPSGALAQRGEH
ncbi:MAG: hypothetical protein JWN13_1915 [Betaproteobacteria bacterium]|jgi:hypothetical protein|nr:hypothetical protein [Betaproteobacteria bacterium]